MTPSKKMFHDIRGKVAKKIFDVIKNEWNLFFMLDISAHITLHLRISVIMFLFVASYVTHERIPVEKLKEKYISNCKTLLMNILQTVLL
jgi:hypothetical protein